MKMRRATTLLAVFFSLFCLSVVAVSNNDTTVNLEGPFGFGKKKAKLTNIPLRRVDHANTGCFVGKIAVGSKFKRGGGLSKTKSNTYEVYFDTLTSNSWMYGVSATTTRYGRRFPPVDGETAGDYPRSPYNCEMSKKSAKDCRPDDGFEEAYPDGSSYKGGSVTDSMQIGPYNLPEVRMGLVNEISTQAYIMRGNEFDGVVGLGPFGWSTHGLTSVLAGIKKAAGKKGKQDATAFSFYVSEDMQSGEITFGGHNPKLLADKFGYTETLSFEMEQEDPYNHGEPVGFKEGLASDTRWGVGIDEMTVNGNLVTDAFMHALVDTAAPHGLIVPDEKYMEMLATSIGNGAELAYDMELLIHCSKLKDLDPLVLKFEGGIEATFEPHEYFPFEIIVAENRKKKKMCASFFVLADRPYYGIDSLWGIGLRFIKKYYVQFKIEHGEEETPMIGFGRSTGIDIPYDGKTDKKKK